MFSATPGQWHLVQHEIKTPPGTVVCLCPYWVLEAHWQAIEEKVARMLKDGVIEESTSPWFNLAIVVPKPDGSPQFCNDFKKCNAISEFDSYPLPQVDDLTESLRRVRFIST